MKALIVAMLLPIVVTAQTNDSLAKRMNIAGGYLKSYSTNMRTGLTLQLGGMIVGVGGSALAGSNSPRLITATAITGGIFFLVGTFILVSSQKEMTKAGLALRGDKLIYNIPKSKKK